MSELVLGGLHKRFGKTTAVEPTDLHFRSGELTALLGPSGCGKTTLLRMIAGLEKPSAGNIYLDGQDITLTPAYQRKFGMVFQSFALFPHLSVGENVAYSLTIAGASKPVRQEKARELLALVQLTNYADRRIGELSGGQRQRVAIARALAQKPRVFLLDEPMSALDAKLREEMQIELRLLQQRLGITTIVVTHDQHEAMTIADNIVVMTQGRTEQTGTPDEIYNYPSSPFIASFIGKANLFEGTVSGAAIRVGQTTLHIDQPVNYLDGTRIRVFVRPERTHISSQHDSNTIAAQITYVRNVGPSLEIHLQSEIGPVLVHMPNQQQASMYTLGETVSVKLPADSLRVFHDNRARRTA
ncbi:MAG: ABC transporter ATP-binding protein [Granulosicoccus sp.]